MACLQSIIMPLLLAILLIAFLANAEAENGSYVSKNHRARRAHGDVRSRVLRSSGGSGGRKLRRKKRCNRACRRKKRRCTTACGKRFKKIKNKRRRKNLRKKCVKKCINKKKPADHIEASTPLPAATSPPPTPTLPPPLPTKEPITISDGMAWNFNNFDCAEPSAPCVVFKYGDDGRLWFGVPGKGCDKPRNGPESMYCNGYVFTTTSATETQKLLNGEPATAQLNILGPVYSLVFDATANTPTISPSVDATWAMTYPRPAQ